jgi:hypothetical protein
MGDSTSAPRDVLEAVISQIAFHGDTVVLANIFAELSVFGFPSVAPLQRWVFKELLGVRGLRVSVGADGIPVRARASAALQELALGVAGDGACLTGPLSTILRTVALRYPSLLPPILL